MSTILLILLVIFGRLTDVFFLSAKQCEVTAYCPCEQCCGQYADGITASGHVIQIGDKFAAAPISYPFGTKLYVPNYGWAVVRDRGKAIADNRIDVFFHTHKEALKWGRQNQNVFIFRGKL